MKTVLIFAMLGAGCGDAVLGATSQEIQDCPSLACTNSPEVAHYGVRDFDLHGLAVHDDGIAIRSEHGRAQIYKDGVGYDLMVDKRGMEGTNPSYPRLFGQALYGAEIVIEQDGRPLFNIHIDRVREIPYAVGNHELIETYAMSWHEYNLPPTPDQHLCNGPLQIGPKDKSRYAQLLGMLPDESLVFAGDIIDVDRKTMVDDRDPPDWNRINIGCAGHTLAKLHLTRNTVSSQPVPDWRGRQATFKMLTADYCGTGRAFTVAGEPLVWKGGPLDDYLLPTHSLEARWTENGAMCLGVPRVKESDLPDAALLFPDVFGDIQGLCPELPDCTNLDPDQLDGAERVSANPAL